MARENQKYEVISTEERARRDPRGLSRVTLLGNSVIVQAGQFPHALEVEREIQGEIPESPEAVIGSLSNRIRFARGMRRLEDRTEQEQEE